MYTSNSSTTYIPNLQVQDEIALLEAKLASLKLVANKPTAQHVAATGNVHANVHRRTGKASAQPRNNAHRLMHSLGQIGHARPQNNRPVPQVNTGPVVDAQLLTVEAEQRKYGKNPKMLLDNKDRFSGKAKDFHEFFQTIDFALRAKPMSSRAALEDLLQRMLPMKVKHKLYREAPQLMTSWNGVWQWLNTTYGWYDVLQPAQKALLSYVPTRNTLPTVIAQTLRSLTTKLSVAVQATVNHGWSDDEINSRVQTEYSLVQCVIRNLQRGCDYFIWNQIIVRSPHSFADLIAILDEIHEQFYRFRADRHLLAAGVDRPPTMTAVTSQASLPRGRASRQDSGGKGRNPRYGDGSWRSSNNNQNRFKHGRGGSRFPKLQKYNPPNYMDWDLARKRFARFSKDWRRERLCITCGSKNHWVRECRFRSLAGRGSPEGDRNSRGGRRSYDRRRNGRNNPSNYNQTSSNSNSRQGGSNSGTRGGSNDARANLYREVPSRFVQAQPSDTFRVSAQKHYYDPETGDELHRIVKDDPRLFVNIKPIETNGEPIKVFVDTGADRPTISKEYANSNFSKLLHPVDVRTFCITIANNGEEALVPVKEKLVFTFEEKHPQRQLTFFVVPFSPHDLLVDVVTAGKWGWSINPTPPPFHHASVPDADPGEDEGFWAKYDLPKGLPWEKTKKKLQPQLDRLPNDIADQLEALLYKHRNLIPKDPQDIGCIDGPGLAFKIELDDSKVHKPIAFPPRRYPHKKAVQLRAQLDDLEKAGIIEEGNQSARWIAAPLPVDKPNDPNGAVRLTIDFTNINPYTVRMENSLPRMDETIEQLKGDKIFAQLDGKSFYWHIPMDPDSKEFTSFRHLDGRIMHWNRMPMGPTNSPAWCTHVVDKIFEGVPHMKKFIDDWVVGGKDFPEVLKRLDMALERCQKYRICIAFHKCSFLVNKIQYLGKECNGEGHGPKASDITKILGQSIPNSKKELLSQHGLWQWIAERVPNLAQLKAPLMPLLRKNTKFKWTDDHTKAWKEVRTAVADAKWLIWPDYEKPFYVMSDASERGIGASLMQQDSDGNFLPICVYSRILKDYESRYSPTQLEMLALKSAMRKFEPYIEGNHFYAIIDHKNLGPIFAKPHSVKDRKIRRWLQMMQHLEFTLVHRPSEKMVPADFLSRYTEPLQHDPIFEALSLVFRIAVGKAKKRKSSQKSGADKSAEFENRGRKHKKRRTSKKSVGSLKIPDDTKRSGASSGRRPGKQWSSSSSGQSGSKKEAKMRRKATKHGAKKAAYHLRKASKKIIKAAARSKEPVYRPVVPSMRAMANMDVDDSDENREVEEPPTSSNAPESEPVILEEKKEEREDSEEAIDISHSLDDASLLIKNAFGISNILRPIDDKLFTKSVLQAQQKADVFLAKWRHIIENRNLRIPMRKLRERSPDIARMINKGEIAVVDGLLQIKRAVILPTGTRTMKWKVIVPYNLRMAYIDFFHSHSTHRGIRQTTENAMKTFWWPRMRKDIRNYVIGCRVCQRVKSSKRGVVGKQQTFFANGPGDIVHLDFVGPLPMSNSGNKMIFTMMDRFTGFVQATATPDSTAELVIEKLADAWMKFMGIPNKLLTDRGTDFRAKITRCWRALFGVEGLFTTEYHPATNGKLERWHADLKNALVALLDEHGMTVRMEGGKDWDKLLPFVVMSHNGMVNVSMGCSPAEAIFGRELPLTINRVSQWHDRKARQIMTEDRDIRQYIVKLKKQITNVQAAVAGRLRESQGERARKANINRPGNPFQVGDIVFRKLGKGGMDRKWKLRNDGPWKVRVVINDTLVGLVLCEDSNTTVRANINRLKLSRDNKLPILTEERTEDEKSKIPSPETFAVSMLHLSHEPSKLSVELKALKSAYPYPRSAASKIEDITPPTVVKLFCKLLRTVKKTDKVCEIMAGSGALSKCLPNGSLCVENDGLRILQGKKEAPKCVWLEGDVLSPTILSKIKDFAPTILLSNPDFSLAIPSLAIGASVLPIHGEVWLLLPSTYFDSSPKRSAWLRTVPIIIFQEFRLGLQSYRAKGTKKRTPDSLFIFQKTKRPTYQGHVSHRVTLLDMSSL